MFAMSDNDHHDSGHLAVWIKAPAMAQEILVHSNPARFFKPPYVGAKGWVGVRLEGKVNWKELAGILKDGYELSLPRKRRAGAQSGSGLAKISALPNARRRRIKSN
jgi:hypothetical protein